MFYRPKNLIPDRIKSNPNDMASTLFVIDTIRSENYKNPIIPTPVRIDKVSNGEFTHIVLPSKRPQIDINPNFGPIRYLMSSLALLFRLKARTSKNTHSTT